MTANNEHKKEGKLRRLLAIGVYDEDGNRNQVAVIINQFVFSFCVFIWFMNFSCLFYFYWMLQLDFDKYVLYILPYGIPLVIATISLHGYFLLRRYNIIRLEPLGIIVMTIGVVTLLLYSLYLGNHTYFFTYLYITVPVPFLVYQSDRKNFVYTGLVIVVTAIAITIVMQNITPEGLLPVPAEMVPSIRNTVMFLLLLNFTIIGYLFWYENNRLQSALIASNKELKHRDYLLRTELDFAADIQKSLMPPSQFQWKNITVLCNTQPMHTVSGDYFDYFTFDDELYILLTDISGHGVPAALVSMLAKQSFATNIRPGRSPAEIFASVNTEMCRLVTTPDYLTAFMIRITQSSLQYCNAGHVPALLLAAGDKQAVATLDSPGLFIGALTESSGSYEAKTLRWQPGDQILLLTDGITEAISSNGDGEYTLDRLTSFLKEEPRGSHQQIFEMIIKDWQSFTAHATLRDDVTLLSIGYGKT